jgi:hypothetical protein
MTKSKEDYQTKEIKLESEQLQHLKNIERQLRTLTSLRWTFVSGLVRGVSTVLGATIVAAIVFAVLAQVLSSANSIPVLNNLIKQSGINELVGKQIEQKFEQINVQLKEENPVDNQQ